MFDFQVFSLTVQKVAFLLLFIAAGYYFRRSGRLKREAAMVLSVLSTHLFATSYNIVTLPKHFTVENLGGNLKILGFSLGLVLFVVLVAYFLGKKLGRTPFEKNSLIYVFAFTNNTYFGLPMIEGVFGEEILAKFIVFCLPVNIVLCSYGYALFSPSQRFDWRKLLSPPLLATIVGCTLGLLEIPLPGFFHDAFSGAAACMSPASMILAGIVLGGIAPGKLFSGVRPYLYAVIRLVGMPLLVGTVLLAVGFRGELLFLGTAIAALPSGMNCVVYPESMGLDATDNAKICFLSCLVSILTLPLIFAILPSLAGGLF